MPVKGSPWPMNRHSFCVNVENYSLNRISKSCPNCSLAILKEFYGLAMKFQDLNIICHKVIEGFTLKNLIKTFRSIEWFLAWISDQDQFGYLYAIDEKHIDMIKLYENVRNCVAANQIGPKLYLYPIYSYYSLLLSDKMKLMTERIFEQDIVPSLPVKPNCFKCLRWRTTAQGSKKYMGFFFFFSSVDSAHCVCITINALIKTNIECGFLLKCKQ